MKKAFLFGTAAVFVFIVILPLLSMTLGSFFKDGAFTLSNYVEVFNTRSLSLLLNSIGIAFAVGFISTLTGGFLAFFAAKTDLPFVNRFKLIYL
ncbi:MAG: hypothetical protein GY765_35055, partial [bacterium]|nr:hypothetical protein [bacterium]